jgi:hypothetical protein
VLLGFAAALALALHRSFLRTAGNDPDRG